jgi:hypothetical protein
MNLNYKKLTSFVLLLLIIGCSKEDINETKNSDSEYKILYKGKIYSSALELESFSSEASVLFNDFAADPNLDYLFDTQDELLEFTSKKYSEKDYNSIKHHFNAEADNYTNNAKTQSWGGFGTVQWTETYCNQWFNLLCNGYPNGEVKDFGNTECGFYPRSFSATVPSGKSITLTYFRSKNFMIDWNCPSSSYKTIFFSEGSHCTDFLLRFSCLMTGQIKTQALSARWTASQ